MVAAFLGGFGNGSDTTFTNFERRDRELQVRIAEQKRHEILYGGQDEQLRKAAAALSSASPSPSATIETPSASTSVPASSTTTA
jgi:hypothetical protein